MSISRDSPTWASICTLILYCLWRDFRKSDPKNRFFSLSDMYAFIDRHWDACGLKKKYLIYYSLEVLTVFRITTFPVDKQDPKKWRKQLQDALSHNRTLFKKDENTSTEFKVLPSMQGVWGLNCEDPERLSPYSDPGTKNTEPQQPVKRAHPEHTGGNHNPSATSAVSGPEPPHLRLSTTAPKKAKVGGTPTGTPPCRTPTPQTHPQTPCTASSTLTHRPLLELLEHIITRPPAEIKPQPQTPPRAQVHPQTQTQTQQLPATTTINTVQAPLPLKPRTTTNQVQRLKQLLGRKQAMRLRQIDSLLFDINFALSLVAELRTKTRRT
ncbi:hypothetical protein Pelo_1557 [Pelomyxa schiedti]|nr:hypothetical protein Pelo_1557 [Pelomyxa schiedti]